MIQEPTPITEAALREQYELSGLSKRGFTFERCMNCAAIRVTLVAAINGRQRMAARQARGAAINFQIQEAA